MTQPTNIYDVLKDLVDGSILVVIVLASFTNFFDNMFRKRDK